jgi:hypothetical protein
MTATAAIPRLGHLDALEAEAITILREVAAEREHAGEILSEGEGSALEPALRRLTTPRRNPELAKHLLFNGSMAR